MIRAVEEAVELRPELADRLLDPRQLLLRVLGQQPPHLDARLVQHGVADGDALDQAEPVEPSRLGAQPEEVAILGAVDDAARGHHLGQHRGDDLERLDLLLGIGAGGPVLHGQDARDPPRAEDRHAQERAVDLLPRLREVAEVGVLLGRRRADHRPCRRDGADQALAHPHPRVMHGLAGQALGREELEQVAGALDVERAHLGHEVGGDHAHDLIEALLRAGGLGHHLDQAAQEPPCARELAGTPRFRGRIGRPPADRGAHRDTASAGRRSPARVSAASACRTSSARMAAVGRICRTRPTLCPAISEPFSMSPSTTARRRAPAQ